MDYETMRGLYLKVNKVRTAFNRIANAPGEGTDEEAHELLGLINGELAEVERKLSDLCEPVDLDQPLAEDEMMREAFG